MACEIYDKSLFRSAKNATINYGAIRALIKPLDDGSEENSEGIPLGVWTPLVVTSSNGNYGKLLSSASLQNNSKFNPCSCNNDIFGTGSGVEDISNSQERVMDNLGECEYCNNSCTAEPCDMEEDDEDPDKQFCDVRFNTDDYIPKIPYMHQGYISGFHDFKHLKEFPAASNPGLGFEGFIKFDLDQNDFDNGKGDSTKPIRIDWKLEEDIGEIPYDPASSRHDSEYIHNKAYTKSLRNKTVGNFLNLTQLKTGELPEVEDFTKPYGFNDQTYDNLFQGNKKLGSHWKWNYSSGILGWYRHYDIYRANDKRPLKGIDLYIPSGDIFFAKTEGPEKDATNQESDDENESNLTCPSGLKLVDGTSFSHILPHGTSFVYISKNIYANFVQARDRISQVFTDLDEVLNKSILLATHPEYDNIVTDLLSTDVVEDRASVVGFLSQLDYNMTQGTDFRSAGNINYCQTKDDLIKTLLHKYGCYYLVDSKTTLEFDSVAGGSSWYVDMDFDMMIKNNTNNFNLTSSQDTSSKFLPNAINYAKKFEYNQKIKVGDTTVMSTAHNSYMAFNESCQIDEDTNKVKFTGDDYINISTVNLFGSTVGELSNNSGQYSFTDMYQAGRLQHDRIYPATAFNPHVDLVAVHPQGGAYVNALPFGLKQKTLFSKNVTSSPDGALKVIFEPEDSVAIKLYGIKIKNLQSKKANSKQCERFPYSQEEKCKCYGFNWPKFNKHFYNDSNAKTWYGGSKYVPNLSTENSPTIKSYGGFSQDYLDSLFGQGVLTAGGDVVSLKSYINPLEPYGTAQSTSITLPNYVNSTWTITPENITTDSHTDVIVEISENVSLTANRFSGDPSSEDYLSNHNMQWKRFTTEVEVKGKTLYDQQAAKVSITNKQSFNVKLHNPYLATLINDRTNAYASPDNSENLISVQPKLYSTRGDESSAVTLTFSKKPKKQLLNFVIPPPKAYGTLSKGFFDPNDGLSTEKKNKSPFINDRLYTEYRFNNGDTDRLEDNKGIFYANITPNMKTLCNQISNFNLNRKLRMYVKIGATWFEVASQNRGSYKQDNKRYIGRPRFFEYLKNSQNSQKIPMLFPAPPKKLFAWNFFLNHADIDNRSVSNNIRPSYPWLNGRNFTISRESVAIPGSRYYFTAEEEIDIKNLNIDDIEEVTTAPPANLSSGRIVKAGDKHYFYNGGPEDEIESYLFLGDRYEQIVGVSNNLELDYAKDISDTGYVYNSFKGCDQEIIVFINNGGVITPIKERYKIISKELQVQGYNIDGRPTLSNPVNYKLKTIFKLNQSLEPIKRKVFAIDVPNKDNRTSLVVFHPETTTDFSRLLRIDQNNLNSRLTKWADVRGLTDPDAMTDLIIEDLDIDDLFPKTPYNNWFYKQIVNNFEPRCDFELDINGTTYYYPNIKATYCILQKYNVENSERVRLKDAFAYQNFIPMMDLTFHNKSSKDFFVGDSTNLGIPIEGLIYSPNWTRNLVDEEFQDLKPPDLDSSKESITYGVNVEVGEDTTKTSLATGEEVEETIDDRNIINREKISGGAGPERFWTEITAEDSIRTAYVPTETVYSDTLRIDDPTFWLDKTSTKTTRNTSDVRTTFTPSAPTLASAGATLQGFSHEVKKRDYAFSIHNIYGDGDSLDKCGAQDYETCWISSRGNVSLYAHLKLAMPVAASNLSDSVQYYTTYDAGLYNPVGQKSYISISRSELSTDNALDSAFDHCSTSLLRPDYKRTVHDPERKSTITAGNRAAHTDIVNKTDEYANEMLFRIMYGDDDPVNRSILLSKKKPLTVEDLVSFTDPKITAADVYDEILYNYDTRSSCGNFINNSFGVRGPMKIGDYYDFSIGGKNIYFSVEQQEDGVYAVGRIGGKTINAKLDGTSTIKRGITVTDVNTVLHNTDTTTYKLRTTSSGACGKSYGPFAARVYTGTCGLALWDYGAVGTTINMLNTKGGPGRGASVYRVDIPNGGNDFYSWIRSNALSFQRTSTAGSSGDSLPNSKVCDDHDIGYCRRKAGCADSCDGPENQLDFLYSFEQCRTTFSVYGHRYKLEDLSQEGIEECFDTSSGGGSSLSISLACAGSNNGQGVRGQTQHQCGCDDRFGSKGPGTVTSNCGCRYEPQHRNAYQLLYDAGLTAQKIAGGYTSEARTFLNDLSEKCDDSGSESPLTGDPGYDLCGNSIFTYCVPPRKYWTYKTTTGSTYDGSCPRSVCTITYTNNSLKIDIAGQTYCIDNSITKCPDLEATLPKHAYISSETIGDPGLADDRQMQMNLNSQTQSFQTIRYRHKEYLGTMAGSDVNATAGVETAREHNCGLFTPPGCCVSSAFSACGSEVTWYAENVNDARGSFAPALAAWIERIQEAFSNLNTEVGVGYAFFQWGKYGYEGQGQDSSAKRAREMCNANKHINSSDIVQGIVPGSCSELQFETTNTTYGKTGYANVPGNQIQEGEGIYTTVKAFIEYDYIRPVTIQDKLKGWTPDSEEYECAQLTSTTTPLSDPYPEWYAQNLGIQTTDTLGYPIQNYGGVNNYIRTKQQVSKSTSCGETLTSYTPKNYNKGGNPKYPYGGAPCAKSDWICWGSNRDWITVWGDDI